MLLPDNDVGFKSSENDDDDGLADLCSTGLDLVTDTLLEPVVTDCENVNTERGLDDSDVTGDDDEVVI